MESEKIAKIKKRFPRIALVNPCSGIGRIIIRKTPIKLKAVPISTFDLGFSFRRKIANSISIIGLDEKIIGTLMLGASRSPKKRKEIAKVIPIKALPIILGISSLSIFKLLAVNGKIMIAPKKNLKKTKVKGGTLVSAHL